MGMELPELKAALIEARQRSLDLLEDLEEGDWLGPYKPTVNPPLWELGHVAWFQQHWVLCTACGEKADLPQLAGWFDSSLQLHRGRWSPGELDREAVMCFAREVLERTLNALEGTPSSSLLYFAELSLYHEDMHDEAFTYTRQNLGHPPPAFLPTAADGEHRPAEPTADIECTGGRFLLGAARGTEFVFDNEKWAHAVHYEPFAIAACPVTRGDFAAFLEAEGYRRPEFWSTAGWRWRALAGAQRPAYWRLGPEGELQERYFNRWRPISTSQPMMHVNWYEAQAYCRYAGRRLPTELEWEVAACCGKQQTHPWRTAGAVSQHANVGWTSPGPVAVGAFSQGDTSQGCNQMLGNVWEWTDSTFAPYPGFHCDPYKDYSRPWFDTHKVLRGGSWATSGRILRNSLRNFYEPHRRDIFAGFRTCATSAC